MHVSRLTASLLAAGFLGTLAHRADAQWVQQQIVLKPGWNAVFLEVDPAPQNCDALLAGVPVESVWEWHPATDAAQFVQDPTTLVPGAPDWLTWHPPNHALAGQGRLFILRDGRPYLMKTTNAQPVTWTVTGKPSLRRVNWRAGAVNLVGFHVGAQGPTFQALFAGHGGLAGQPVYSLDATGVWRAIPDPATARPKSGEGYWVRCKSPAQAAGTHLVETGSRRGIHFGPSAAEGGLRIRNASTGARNLSVRLLASVAPPAGESPSTGPVPLEYWRANHATTNFNWEPLSAPLNFTGLPAGQEWNLRLGVRRHSSPGAPAGSTYQSLLEVTDDLGTRWLIPVTADAIDAGAPGFQAATGPGGFPHAGVWVGEAVLKAVSQPAHPGNPAVTRTAGGNFTFRMIAHVDGTGSSRLLQQVYLVRKPPVLEPDPEDPATDRVVEPARTVAVTDEMLIPEVLGTTEIIGRRISSAAFAFREPVALAGDAFGAGTLQGAITLDYDDPLNPFKHLFHPDHNNLDERFEQTLPEGREAFTVTRSLSLEFTATDPLGLNPPGWGSAELGGNYRETITGLHRSPIQVSGTFRLVKVSASAALNQ